METETQPELSISLVEVKQELEEEEEEEEVDSDDLIINQVLSEHDYVFVKREAEYDTAATVKTELPSSEQFAHLQFEEDDDDMEEEDDDEEEEEEEDNDKIQAAKTLAELSILPVRLSQPSSLELPDLRRTSGSVLSPSGLQKYSCNICGKQYSTSSNLARHRQTHRSPDHSKARRCNLCNKVRQSPSSHITMITIISSPGLRLYAGLLDAHENPLGRTRLPRLWEDILQAVATEGTHADPHRREAVQLSRLQ